MQLTPAEREYSSIVLVSELTESGAEFGDDYIVGLVVPEQCLSILWTGPTW